jgi:hypothetical protein
MQSFARPGDSTWKSGASAPRSVFGERGFSPRVSLVRNHRRLPGDLKPFAATHVLAGHHVVFAHHVRSKLRKTRTVAIVGTSGELTLFGADDPCNFIVRGFMAMWTV